MKVQELMTKEVKTCARDSNLAEVAQLLWEGDCGVSPVVDDEGHVIGIISDRDICFAVATKGRLASDILASEVASGKSIHTCAPDDDIQDALSVMQQYQVRRIPVINGNGQIAGILSISDVVNAVNLETRDAKQGVSTNETMSALKAICEPRQIAPNTAAASSGSATKA